MVALTNHGLRTPYYSVTMVALVAGADHYYEHLKQYVANIRGVSMTTQNNEDDDLQRIREVSAQRNPQDGTPPLPIAAGRDAELEINRSLVPFVIFSPDLFDTVLKNAVPESKFEAWYTGTDGVKYKVKTRAVSFAMKVKTYVTNWAQAMVIAEYLLAATPNTMKYTYPMFNLPMADDETMETSGTMVLTGPSIRRVYKRESDGHLYVITQDVVLNFTIAVLPPGNQEDNGTSSEGDGTPAPVVSRFNLDIWAGLLKEDDESNWMAGAAIMHDPTPTDDNTSFALEPTAKDLPNP